MALTRAAVSPQVAIERRRSQVEIARSVEGKNLRVSYFISVTGVGEGFVRVNFPVRFHERPAVFSGGELDVGEEGLMVPGLYPTWNAGVIKWYSEYRGGTYYYTGAKVCYVVSGRASDETNGGQKSIVHFHVEGPTLSNPLPGTATEPPSGD